MSSPSDNKWFSILRLVYVYITPYITEKQEKIKKIIDKKTAVLPASFAKLHSKVL